MMTDGEIDKALDEHWLENCREETLNNELLDRLCSQAKLANALQAENERLRLELIATRLLFILDIAKPTGGTE